MTDTTGGPAKPADPPAPAPSGSSVTTTTAAALSISQIAPVIEWIVNGMHAPVPDAVCYALAAASIPLIHIVYKGIAKFTNGD